MKEKIGRLSKGILDYKPTKLMVSEEAINITVETGKTFHGSFRVYNSENKVIKGLLYSSSLLLKLKDDRFVSADIDITYEFEADYLEPGSELDGYISIISEGGERKLPFSVIVLPPVCSSSIGDILDMHLYAELVRQKPEEAKSIFLSNDFRKVLKHYHSNMLNLYDSLVKSSNTYIAIEEFLISAGIKERVTISIDRCEYSYDTGLYNFVDYINIHRDGWGYNEVYINSDSCFIEVDKKKIISDDFTNNECRIPFIIKADKIKTGTQTGSLRIESIYQSIEVKVICHCTKPKDRKKLKDRKERMLFVKITSNYIDFRVNKISAKEYIKTAERLKSELHIQKNFSILNHLYHVHLLYVSGKNSIAINMLEGLNITKEANTFIEYATYLYLRILLNKEAGVSLEAYDEFQRLFIYDDSHPLMFFMMLYINKRYETDIVKKHEDIKAYIMSGSKSVIIYYEAASLIKMNPFLIKELGIFEQKILCFMIKHDIYEKDIAITLNSHVLKIKKYNQIVYYILKSYYEKYQTKELLMSLTAMLIKGHKTDKKYFHWYERAIKERIKLSELFEYYILASRNAGITALDSLAYTYFLNSAGLKPYIKSWLYYSLLQNNNSELIKVYFKDICSFVMEQLEKKKIDKVLSLIYKYILADEDMSKPYLSYLPDVMFMYEITCYSSSIEKVMVIYNEISKEETYILKDGHAYINICSNNAELLFTDSRGNRYVKSVEYNIEKLFYPEIYARICFKAGLSNDEIIIWLCSQLDSRIIIDREAYSLKTKAVISRLHKEEFRQSYIRDLIYYHYNNYDSGFLEKYLTMADYHYVVQGERNRFIECLISMNLCQTAVKMITEFSYEGIDIIRIQKLCAYMLRNIQKNQESIDILTKLCWLVFEAGYMATDTKVSQSMASDAKTSQSMDIELLNFLTENYYGNLDEMIKIFKIAREYEIDTLRIEERLIIQHLFTENDLTDACDIFSRYYKRGLNKRVIKAFLTYYSYQYLVSSQNVIIKPVFFEIADKELGYEENEICLLAYLKYLSKKESISDKETLFVDYHMNKFSIKDIVLPFFLDFNRHMKIPSNMPKKYYIEYYSEPMHHITINYQTIANEGNASMDEYTQCEMKHACYGIYVFELLLFYGEVMSYYITDEYEGNKTVTKDMVLKMENNNICGEDIFIDKLNRILEAKDIGDDLVLLENIESYMKLKHAADKLFTPLV